jgi:hypothetical protein
VQSEKIPVYSSLILPIVKTPNFGVSVPKSEQERELSKNRPLESILSTFYEQLLCQYSCNKKLQSQNIPREKLCKRLSYKKGASKMLMKLTPRERAQEM